MALSGSTVVIGDRTLHVLYSEHAQQFGLDKAT